MARNISVKVDMRKAIGKVDKVSPKAMPIVSQQILKDSNFFIPADTWNLRDSSLKFSDFKKGKLIWKTRYAAKLYKGVWYNFSTDKNPNAGAKWFDVAKSYYLHTWLRVAEKAVAREL